MTTMDMGSADVRKIALLVATLDDDSAEQLLQRLPAPVAAAARELATSLGCDDRADQARVLREFLHGREQIGRLGEEPSRQPKRAVAPPRNSAADGPLERASERLIADCLTGELPQAIAVALAQLPAQRASEVVAYLPAPQQTEVLERLVELEPASASNLPEIRDEFQAWLGQQLERSLHRAELANRLATILDATHRGTRERILANVSASDARLAKELQHLSRDH